MSEGNISGFFRQTRQPDYGNDAGNTNYSNLKARRARADSFMASLEKPLNVRMPSLPSFRSVFSSQKSNYMRNYKSYRGKSTPVDTGKIMNLAIYAGIGLVGYKLYQKFFGNDSSNAISAALDADTATKAKTVIAATKDSLSTSASSVAMVSTAKSLNGLVGTAQHNNIAEYFYTSLNHTISASNQDGVVKQINAMSSQTLLLVYSAFGVREFVYNPLSTEERQKRLDTEGFFSLHWRGNLVDGLQLKLSSANYAKISKKIDSVLKQLT